MQLAAFSLAPPPTITLRAGCLSARIAPTIGGALVSLSLDLGDGRTFEVLRPATPQALAASNPRKMACFPMVPFASLVHQGRFTFLGKPHRLARNIPERDVALHGDAWQHPWSVIAEGPQSLLLGYRQDGDRFPYPFAATLETRIEPERVCLTLEVRNTGAERMPTGLGFHPFFNGQTEATLAFGASAVWRRDTEGRVLATRPCAPDETFAAARPVTTRARNDVYEGWDGKARITWPDAGVTAELHAGPPLSRLLLFVPDERAFFCVEPISNLPDGFNLLSAPGVDPGIAVLAPGATLQAAMQIAVRPH